MMAAGISWVGMDALQKRLFEAHLNALEALGGALYLEGELIMTKSKDDYVPVDFGALKGSGFVETPEYSAHEATVTLGYGGPAGYREAVKAGIPAERAAKVPGYALFQHEGHYKHTGQGQRKYLQTPVNEAQQGLAQRIARRIKRRIL